MNMPHCCKLSALKKTCSCQEILPSDFVPSSYDVICARGKAAKSHPGNIRYQAVVESYMDRYVKSESKLQKMSIISEIVTKVRICSPNGGFVKRKDGRWYEVGDHFAREKVSQSLRDSLHVFYRSSCKSKTTLRAIRRKETDKSDDAPAKQNQIHERNSIPFSIPISSAFPTSNYFFSSRLLGSSQKHQRGMFSHQVGPDTHGISLQRMVVPSIATNITESDLMVARILLAQAHQQTTTRIA